MNASKSEVMLIRETVDEESSLTVPLIGDFYINFTDEHIS